MKLFHLLGFTKGLFCGSSTSGTILNLFSVCFIDGSHFFKKSAGRICHAFEVFGRGCILSELTELSELFSSYKLFLRVTEIVHLLTIFLSLFLNSVSKRRQYFTGPHY